MIDSILAISYLFSHPFGNPHPKNALIMTSPAFANHHIIPDRHTCFGAGRPIPLHWRNIPKGTKSLALIMTDQDISRKTKYYHWAVFNIDPKPKKHAANFSVANNSWHHKNYQPPCPTQGTHHYQLKLYALNIHLPQEAANNPILLRKDMQHHILATAKITGQVKAKIK